MAANQPTDSTQTNEATTSTPSDNTQTNEVTISTPRDSTPPIGGTNSTPSDSTQTNEATISTPSNSTQPIGGTTSRPSDNTQPIGAKTSNNSTIPKKDVTSMAATDTSSKKPTVTKEDDDASSKNLLQQLPAGAVLAFQALAATFTNQGSCYTSNWWLTAGLVTFLSAACIIFPFTDTVIDKDGILRRGVALPSRLHIINLSMKEQRPMWADLRKRRLKPVDYVHAFLGLVVFLTIAGNDVGLQNCFFPYATDDTRQLFRNLPLGMAVMASFLFMIFPTTRKGIRFDKCELAPSGDTTSKTKQEEQDVTKQGSEKEPSCVSPKDLEAQNPTVPSCDPKSNGTDQGNVAKKAADKLLDTSTNLLQLLPTGPVLAFQTLASSFTNQGKCYRSNWWLTVGLVIFLTATCVFFCFTDSVKDLKDNKKVHKGVALPRGLCILSTPKEDQKDRIDKSELRKRALKPVDWVHAFFTAVVFLTIAGSDVGLQYCFFPKANDNTKQMLKNLPLGMAVMSSFVFMIFPTTRKGICFDNSEYKIIETRPASGESDTDPCNDGNKVQRGNVDRSG